MLFPHSIMIMTVSDHQGNEWCTSPWCKTIALTWALSYPNWFRHRNASANGIKTLSQASYFRKRPINNSWTHGSLSINSRRCCWWTPSTWKKITHFFIWLISFKGCVRLEITTLKQCEGNLLKHMCHKTYVFSFICLEPKQTNIVSSMQRQPKAFSLFKFYIE